MALLVRGTTEVTSELHLAHSAWPLMAGCWHCAVLIKHRWHVHAPVGAISVLCTDSLSSAALVAGIET